MLKEEYGDKLRFGEEPDDELFEVFQTNWYKQVRERLTPGKNLRIYRQNMSLTQSQLGKLLGDVPKQFVLNLENGVRPISKKVALKLARIFEVSVDRFIG